MCFYKMKVKIVKNFIKDKDFFNSLVNHFLFDVPHYFGHTSLGHEKDRVTHGFYMCQLNPEAIPYKFIIEKMKKIFSFKVKKIYINVQHRLMDGSFHKDCESDKDVTALLMIRGDGFFEIKNENKYPLVPNTLILFPGNKIHKGHAPINDSPRITLAVKCEVI
tara:strand:+ start:1335 stop:1823 length:489 start_codon:yes stop_codon:yes gene_type:complete